MYCYVDTKCLFCYLCNRTGPGFETLRMRGPAEFGREGVLLESRDGLSIDHPFAKYIPELLASAKDSEASPPSGSCAHARLNINLNTHEGEHP